MEGAHLRAGGVEELRFERIQDGMPRFMADDIRAFSRKKRPVPHGLVEEEQPALTVARIEGIEVFPSIQSHVHWVRYGPARASGQQRGPEVNGPRQRLGCDPIAEVRGTGGISARRRSGAEDLRLQ